MKNLENFNRIILLGITIITFLSCSSDSSDPAPDPDTVAPTVDFTIAGISDSSNSQTVVVSSQIQINIDAEDKSGIAKVEAFINGEKVGEDTTAPYQITIDVSGFASKVASTAKFQDYVLKVVVTDSSGNSASKEQIINIDNEIPVISNLSISENQIIGGDFNEVTFEIEENQGLESVEIYINNQLYQELDTNSFSFNLQTSELTDGANTLKIVARDLADNIALFEVPFISDNTGPEISIENLSDDQIIDGTITIAPNLADEYSELFSLSIEIDEQALLAVENPENESYVFNSLQFPTGTGTFRIVAKDVLLNTTEVEIPITILRRLLEVNVPANYFDSNLEVIIFLSKLDGSLLDEAVVSQDEQQIVFRTALDLEPEEKTMLTFALNSPSPGNDFARFYSISDIDINILPIINLDYKPLLEHSYQYYEASGFTTDDRHAVRAASTKYQGNLVWDDPNKFQFYKMDCSTCPAYEMENYYFIIRETDTQPYQYTWIPAPIDANTILDKQNFTTAGIEQRFVQAYNLPSSNYQLHLEILGYLNEEEFIGDYYHLMDENSISYWEVGPNGIGYNYNDDFESYATKIKLRNYQPSTQGYQLTSFGAVIESFTIPDWTVDWVETNRVITINKSGSGDILGKIELGIDNHGDENFVPYDWNIIFNSAETSSVKLPELPETIKSWDFYSDFVEKPLFIQQVDIKKYEGISDYDDYLQKVIKDNKSPHLASPRIESVFNRNPLATSDSYDYFYWLFD
ncbi:fibronectin type III domain-containing protein [Allomuricauda ruestringensis DSM 13258]|uniref:Fibronectin type III domain-containing protein n=1 Tax=Allomuricauda ruestringensis (strain DSM 13258 / CIP 107369 / LMG 19739 / B1) TaxID=886377 RepID=G2PMY3_ALLRU|nr:Ig-like domain-containing protein [Allomuricauda ruestringensis]AEM71295.1 fibronectin type III domain-containing protein [Allomuricauda ruestringensis DSM 13258]